jgi:hypothetical protein
LNLLDLLVSGSIVFRGLLDRGLFDCCNALI